MTPYDTASPHVRPDARTEPLVDGFGRAVTYLRVSVTDRCDLRCVYCMSEHMTFLPKAEVLTLEEIDRIASAFVALGTRKLRLTGGEPLMRKGLMTLIGRLSRHLESGALEELTLTTNGTRLAEFAGELAAAGVRRISVGGAFARAALGAFVRAALEVRDQGTFGFAADAMPYAETRSYMDSSKR